MESERVKEEREKLKQCLQPLVCVVLHNTCLSECKKSTVTETGPLASLLEPQVPLKVIIVLTDKCFSSAVTLKCKPMTHLALTQRKSRQWTAV